MDEFEIVPDTTVEAWRVVEGNSSSPSNNINLNRIQFVSLWTEEDETTY